MDTPFYIIPSSLLAPLSCFFPYVPIHERPHLSYLYDVPEAYHRSGRRYFDLPAHLGPPRVCTCVMGIIVRGHIVRISGMITAVMKKKRDEDLRLLGTRIRQMRQIRGLSQEQLALEAH